MKKLPTSYRVRYLHGNHSCNPVTDPYKTFWFSSRKRRMNDGEQGWEQEVYLDGTWEVE